MATSRPLRVLGLHGWRTNAKFLEFQFCRYSGLQQKLEGLLEVTYLDAPHAASGAIPDGVDTIVEGPFYEWWDASLMEGGKEWDYKGMEESVSFVLDYMKLHGPFDGLLGFSQGGTLSAVLAALCQKAQGGLEAPPRFCVIFGGLMSRDHRHHNLYDDHIRLPAFITYGEKDPGSPYTKKLVAKFSQPVVVSHPGGHVVPPLNPEQVEQLRLFLTSCMSRM